MHNFIRYESDGSVRLTNEGLIVDAFTEIIGEKGMLKCDKKKVALVNSVNLSQGKFFYLAKLTDLYPVDFSINRDSLKDKLTETEISSLENILSNFSERYNAFYILADTFTANEDRERFRDYLTSKKDDGSDAEKNAYEMYNENILRSNSMSLMLSFLRDMLPFVKKLSGEDDDLPVLRKIGSFMRIIWKDRAKTKISEDPKWQGLDIDDLLDYAKNENERALKIMNGEDAPGSILDSESTTFFTELARQEEEAAPYVNLAEKINFFENQLLFYIKQILKLLK